jgi:hypothetical protein
VGRTGDLDGVTDCSNDSGYGQFVLATIGLVIIVVDRIVGAFKPTAAPDLDDMTDVLARAMRIQWENAANDRRLLQPGPLPIRWRRSAEPVASPLETVTVTRDGHAPFDPRPGERATRSNLSSGDRRVRGPRRDSQGRFADFGASRFAART